MWDVMVHAIQVVQLHPGIIRTLMTPMDVILYP
jgi:hypothetical protein